MHPQIKTDKKTGQTYLAVRRTGAALLEDPLTNKGTAFPAAERAALGLRGLLPPAQFGIKDQLARTYAHFRSKATPLEQHIYLTSLHDRNEILFYRLLQEHIEEMMPIIYTPTVGEACQQFSHIYRRPRGVFVSYDLRAHIPEILRQAADQPPKVIVVTDGERILGLGDQGVGGMGISIGKLSLYTLCAGIAPHDTLPVMLDVGTENAALLADPLYLGLRRPRVRGARYQAFVDAFVRAVQTTFPHTLLQWEDFLKGNAIKQLQRFRDRLCTFNDDIQGTAAVALAGIYSALRITRQPLQEQRVVFAGAGAAAQGIADLIVMAMVEAGLSREVARQRIWTVDSKGLVTADRPQLDDFKRTYARDPAERAAFPAAVAAAPSLVDVVRQIRPTILIGTSGVAGMFSPAVIAAMAETIERPIIFPLSNPTSKAECTPTEALRWSQGRAIVATGSPFAPVDYEGRRYRVGQGNNAYIFPGIGLGVTTARIPRVTDGMFLAAARALANTVQPRDLAEGALYPPLPKIRAASRAVASAVIRRAVADGLIASRVLTDLAPSIADAMWTPTYLPIRHER